MTSNEKLDYIIAHFNENPEACYFSWQGIYPMDDHFYRINMVFIYLICKYKNTIIARKVAGTVHRQGNSKKMVFSTDLLRATNTRTGRKRVVLPDRLYIDEEARPAGLIKNVENGTLPYQINPVKEGDRGLLDVLHKMVSHEEPVVTDTMPAPLFYLCAYEPEVYKPKPCAELINMMKNSEKYEAEAPLDDNFRNCFEDCFPKMSDNRWVANFKWVTGKGIPYVDLSSLFEVYSYKGNVTELDCNDDLLSFSIASSLKW